MYFGRCSRFRAALGDERQYIYPGDQCGSKSTGKPEIIKMVSEEDLKTILYVPAVRAKYPWLEAAVSNSEAYMQWEECCLAEAAERKIPVSAAERFQM